MTSYRKAWSTVVVVLGGLCVLLALIAFDDRTVLAAVVGVCVLASSAVFLSAGDAWDGKQVRSNCARVSVVGAAGVVALMGAVHAFGPAGLGLCLAVLLSSPVVLSQLSKQALALSNGSRLVPAAAGARPVDGRHRPWAGPRTAPAAHERVPLVAMSDSELVLAWQLSCIHHSHVHTTADRLVLAQQRAALLDEVQRRDPAGFAAWMHSGSFGDPSKFLSSGEATGQE